MISVALIKSQFPSSCFSGFLLYQSLQISLGVQMVVPAAFHYHPPKSATPVLASLFFSGIPSLKTFWHPSLFLSDKHFSKLITLSFFFFIISFSGLHCNFSCFFSSLTSYFISAFWVPLLCSISRCWHAAGLCPKAPGEG